MALECDPRGLCRWIDRVLPPRQWTHPWGREPTLASLVPGPARKCSTEEEEEEVAEGDVAVIRKNQNAPTYSFSPSVLSSVISW